MGIVGERLRLARERAGLSLGQVREYEGIQKGHLSEMEQGAKNPTGQTIARLAVRYHTSADYLLGLTDDPAPRNDEPLPAAVRELVELALRMGPQRQYDVLAVAQALREVEQQDADQLREFDRMMHLIELAGGEDAIAALESALRANAAGDTVRALRLVEAFFAGRDAKETLEEERDQV